MTTRVCSLDPLSDARWDELLARHPRASVFHSRAWIEALKRTYGYEPLVVTTTEQGPLDNALLLCRVKTWRSGRLVSLPFSDHCEPLVDQPHDLSVMLTFLSGELPKMRCKSFELRPRHLVTSGLGQDHRYCLHTLDLARPADAIFAGFHHSSTQRSVRRAEREGLTYESGRSDALMDAFYSLLRLTRRRHGLPPQPIAWFRNLLDCMGDALTIHAASKDGHAVASLLTLSFKKTIVYKYGGSNAEHHHLGAMPFLFWRAIQEAQAQGLEEMDLGRSDLDQSGLVAFKDHLGARRWTLTYYTWPERRQRTHDGLVLRAAHYVFAHLPDAALDLSGRVLYRHLG